MVNSLMVIHPYNDSGVWVFDDETRGLVKEPFVSGIPEMIESQIGSARSFSAIFADRAFPGHGVVLDWTAAGEANIGGDWYRLRGSDMIGWLCPALLKYFNAAPKQIFIQFLGGSSRTGSIFTKKRIDVDFLQR